MVRRHLWIFLFALSCFFSCRKQTSQTKQVENEPSQAEAPVSTSSESASTQFPAFGTKPFGSPSPTPTPTPPITIESLWAVIGAYIEAKQAQAKTLDPEFEKQTFFCFDHAFLLYSHDFVAFAASKNLKIDPMYVLAFDANSSTTFGHTGVVLKTSEVLYGEKWWYSEYNKKVPFGPYLEGGVRSFWGLSNYVFESAGYFVGYEVSLNAKKILKSIAQPLDYTPQAKPLRRVGGEPEADLKIKKAGRY